MRSDMRGFTLIELIVVIVIIGVLASIAAPMFGAIRAKAICAEAVTSLGVVRSSLRQYYAEYRQYPTCTGLTMGAIFSNGNSAWFPGLALRADGTYGGSSMDGIYTSQECYLVVLYNDSNPQNNYVRCYVRGWAVDSNNSPKKTDTQGIAGTADYIQMQIDNGRITSTITSLGYPSS